MSNIAKANKLQKAITKLQEVDALVQEALGMSDECFDVHCGLEDLQETLQEYADMLVEMQITD